jgi:hypothetical protein
MSYNLFRTIKGDVAEGEFDKEGNPRVAMAGGQKLSSSERLATAE